MAYQDFKERRVLWYIFPLIAVLSAFIHFTNTIHWKVFVYYMVINCILVSCVIAILYIYTNLIAKKAFLDHSIGLGDILFFYAFALGFPSTSFVVLFVCAILFSLFTFLSIKNRFKLRTIPLAGLMGTFLILIFSFDLFFNTTVLYGH
ncbi:hypothetical protein DX873_00885 [Flagellimonas nanhaiensis]|uniref:Prepilin type IV endopeptidase peptidase domain-containing protein n=1 Tax=Flagellimonas nanhaiensis TaxID=2292706 RepID=A0A371JSP3_9FLAO|nr:hypothetical protein DX873_00885 [Allomuricauda nanhaiensis]